MWLYEIAFAILIILGERAIPYIQWVSATLSAANGFFYTPYALQLLSYMNDQNRDACYGVQNALGGVIGIVLPLITGFVQVAFEDFSGYRIVFLIGLLLSFIATTSLPTGAVVYPVGHPVSGMRKESRRQKHDRGEYEDVL